ncbi:EF-hand domain-containing family member C2-like [Belonocnema kinseyi]|uniref:EF-hand domain-containing family member C2-like n=1 Tax=Belonocnema kinseyi TaxID=2817044 RepID=UPI00143CCEB1|nr:EF-hand domain-containing family member C2-like [Belonocnema kinseyi]
MNRAPALPCLPGFNFDTKIGQTKFHRSHLFDKIHDGVYYLAERPNVAEHSRYPSIYARGESQVLPPWLAFDGQRLMFKGYFQETVHERWKSSLQIRTVNISFFLEDGTMKISEPVTDNSGIEQGLIVRRQRISMPNPLQYRNYDIIDLNIGKELEVYGRVYKIVDCDKFTRNFLNRMGIPVPDRIELPSDPCMERRKEKILAKKPNRTIDTRGKFLQLDKQILRFYGYWDDRESPYGEVHNLEIHYYLADDTMEIKEILPPNSGRDSGPLFLKRSKIPKFFESVEPIGLNDPFTVLNVLGEETVKSYYIVDSLNTGNVSPNYYKDHELTIGAQINVFGRKVVITDLDYFTKEYYRKKYGIEEFTPLEGPLKKSDYKFKVEKYIPPYNGYGSYEDSLGNCFTVTPKASNVDFIKFYYYDKQGCDSHVLRFRAKMISKIPENAERHFLIRIYLMDETVAIFELSRKNSGFQRCLFQKRMRVMLPGQDIYTNKPPKFYKPSDFFVGARVNLCGFHFQLNSADLYALRYMELKPEEFPKANIKLIMEKVRDFIKPVYKEFVQELTSVGTENGVFVVEYKDLREIVCKYLVDSITEHEIITIARRYSYNETKDFYSKEYIRALVHTEINRFLWTELSRLEEDILHIDRERTDYLPRNKLYTILRGCRIPLDLELLNAMLDHISKDKEEKINYRDLLQFLNVKINPVTPLPPVNVKSALWWASENESTCGAVVDLSAFLKDLNLNKKENSA